MQAALDGAVRRVQVAARPWAVATGPAAVFLLTMRRIGWRVESARCLVTDEGRRIDLTAMAPAAVARLAEEATRRWADCQAVSRARHSGGGYSVFWQAMDPLLQPAGKKAVGLDGMGRACLVNVLSGAEWPQARQFAEGRVDDATCLLCGEDAGTRWHRRFSCPPWAPLRRQQLSAPVAAAAEQVRQLGSREAELFARALLPLPGWLPPVTSEAHCQICWVLRPADGLLTGRLFLDGSCLHPRYAQLRRAGWAVVQVDEKGSVVAAA